MGERIYIDCNGTLLGNPDVPIEAAIQALVDLGRAHDVTLCSSAPELIEPPIAGMRIVDKFDLFRADRIAGAYLVDDEERIRSCWERCGGHAVAAADLVRFAERMTGR